MIYRLCWLNSKHIGPNGDHVFEESRYVTAWGCKMLLMSALAPENISFQECLFYMKRMQAYTSVLFIEVS